MQFLGKPCPVCSETFREDDDIVVCPKCGAPYHRECYQEKGKCIFSELHRSGESWKAPEDEKNKTKTDDQDVVKCLLCGTENPAGSVVCKECGAFLSRTKVNVHTSVDGEEVKDGTGGEAPFDTADPFAAFFDPMGGIPKDEDLGGAAAGELAKFVGSNTSYYIPIFARIKNINTSRFNFCACFFAGAWHLYRKQYLKGALISALYFILEIGMMFCSTFYSAPLFSEANQAFEEMNYAGLSITSYISWAMENKSFWDCVVMFSPYLILLLIVVMKIICGFRANRGYYSFALARVKKVKASDIDGASMKKLPDMGGVNTAAAWMFAACIIILRFASMFI